MSYQLIDADGVTVLLNVHKLIPSLPDLLPGQHWEPAPPPTIDEIRSSKWEEIKGMREQRKIGGVKLGTKWFHSDDASKIQQIALVMMGASMPAGILWKTMDGSFVPMSPTLAGQIFAAEVAHDQALFAAAEAHNAAMMASSDPANYDFSTTGWPATFEDA